MAGSLYDTLGVSKTATADEIKKAYRKLARKYHPDTNSGDEKAEERFKEVQQAYDILGDDAKRKQYDTFGSGNGRPGQPGGFDVGDFDLGDIFGGLFGGRGRGGAGGGRQQQQPPRGQRGSDAEVPVRISFDDSLKGLQTTVPVTLELHCSICHGTGAAPGTAPTRCPECSGSGVVATSQGLFALQQPCPRCRGNGSIVEKPCQTCRGSGRERRTKRYTVRIPAGVKDGTRIKLKGKGEAGFSGGASGDLYVVTKVDASKIYERRGDDLVLEVPVTFDEAALGATVEIPTPDGRVSLKIPAGSTDGKMLRVGGRGAPKIKGVGRGDLLARLKLTVPAKPSKAEREAIEAYKKASKPDPRARLFQA